VTSICEGISLKTQVGLSEIKVLAAMKKLAVREENISVARVRLQGMRQDRKEPICGCKARLRGQASAYRYTQQCKNREATVVYSILRPLCKICYGRG